MTTQWSCCGHPGYKAQVESLWPELSQRHHVPQLARISGCVIPARTRASVVHSGYLAADSVTGGQRQRQTDTRV